MPRVEVKVKQEVLDLWDRLAKIMDINRSSLVKIAMSQYVRHNRMLFKLDAQKNQASIKDYENELKKLKEIDADELQIVKIPKPEE